MFYFIHIGASDENFINIFTHIELNEVSNFNLMVLYGKYIMARSILFYFQN